MMEIVIDIPHNIYEKIIDGTIETDGYFKANLIECFKSGTLLPEHHGRLIDADALYEKSRLCHTEEDGTACVEWREINDAPTIIEGSESE